MGDDGIKIQTPTCVGGPACGRPVTLRTGAWTFRVPDRLRQQIHSYERQTPNDPAFYFKGSEPILPRPILEDME